VPSTVLALKIANKLNCSVEDLFKLPWCKGYDLSNYTLLEHSDTDVVENIILENFDLS
jgi:DNA-binding XRE family transcriptional regulator